MQRVTAKLTNMRKPQEFIVSTTDKGNILVQSDKSIGMFQPDGRGVLNTRGCYFPHLSRAAGAVPYQFPQEFVDACRFAAAKSGDLLGATTETGPVYFAGVKEI